MQALLIGTGVVAEQLRSELSARGWDVTAVSGGGSESGASDTGLASDKSGSDPAASRNVAEPKSTAAQAGLNMLVIVCPCPQEPTDCTDMNADIWAQGCEQPIAEALTCLAQHRDALLATKGHVVFVVPSFAMSGAKGFSATAAAGEGLRTLAKGAAKQWGKDNVRVNTIALDPQHFVPGESGKQLSAVMGLATSSGFGHKGDIATDIASALNWLTAEDASFITGATLTLDGGIWMAG